GHSLVGMALLQERHRFGAPRLQLSGSAFGSHEPYYATARMIYPLFMRDSIEVVANLPTDYVNPPQIGLTPSVLPPLASCIGRGFAHCFPPFPKLPWARGWTRPAPVPPGGGWSSSSKPPTRLRFG